MIPVEPSDPNAASHFLSVSAVKLKQDYLPRLEKALAVIPEELLWKAESDTTNSPANLLLHMSGNLRQWVISGVGGVADVRNREEEFAAGGGMTKAELLALIVSTVNEACEVLGHIHHDELLAKRTVQVYTVTALEAVYHAVEHFSYHLGQIIHIAKRLSGKDLNLYPF